MPKMKTDRGAAKRFKITGTGRIRRRKAFRSHILEKKSSVRTRRLAREADVAPADRRQIKRLLGL
ncbi:MAG: 50S ribosomal protein L35 [Acidimicrobiales bacterium]